MATPFLAHSPNDRGDGVPESVHAHILRVTMLARKFASAFGMEQQAEVAGLLHDLGKYSEQFQRRLAVRGEPSRDHWSIGAWFALKCYESRGLYPALAINAHHVGLTEIPLPTWTSLFEELDETICADIAGNLFTTNDRQQVWKHFLHDKFKLPQVDRYLKSSVVNPQATADMLDVRMLFSALVDADFLATEGHFTGNAAQPYCERPPGCELNLEPAIQAFTEFLSRLRSAPATPMQPVRDQLSAACLTGAESPIGAYTLSAPTGSGKTLAMLAFALLHARKHGLRRIVVVLPFLNIIEQTAKIYREIFANQSTIGPNFILEDHSLADNPPDRSGSEADEQRPSDQRRRLLAENWDAPIIITTNVQLLESLHAGKPARCRKLHRLARSVILFDEVQTLPPHLVKATLGTLSRLSDPQGPYQSTVVFATATQPAFGQLHSEVKKLSSAGWQPRELVPNPGELFALASERVNVHWRHDETLSFDQLVNELASHERVLCIVNLKRHAIELVNALKDRGVKGVMHLSTNLCASHRLQVLDKVKTRLKENGTPIRLIATQCVEAGVDLSFPVVMRSLGPLEAIAQAAGRCNRSGEGPTGTVIVFRWPTEAGKEDQLQYPPGYAAAVSATSAFLKNQNLDHDLIHSPDRIREYYRLLYALYDRPNGVAPDEKQIDAALCTVLSPMSRSSAESGTMCKLPVATRLRTRSLSNMPAT